MIPAAIERNYPKRLLKAGWWHMSLFQQPVRWCGKANKGEMGTTLKHEGIQDGVPHGLQNGLEEVPEIGGMEEQEDLLDTESALSNDKGEGEED